MSPDQQDEEDDQQDDEDDDQQDDEDTDDTDDNDDKDDAQVDGSAPDTGPDVDGDGDVVTTDAVRGKKKRRGKKKQ